MDARACFAFLLSLVLWICFLVEKGQMFNVYVQSQAVIADASHGRSLWFYPSTASVTGGGAGGGYTVTLTETSFTIRCYVCNTHIHGSDCGDIMTLSEERKKKYNIDCSTLAGGNNYTKCRKMVQNFNDKHDFFKDPGEIRYIRQCAIRGDAGCKRRLGTKSVEFMYCQCEEDLCNSSGNNPPLLTVALFSVVLSYVIPTIKDCLLSF